MTATAVGLQERSGEGWLARTRSRWLLVALGIGIGTLAAVAPYLSSRSGPVSDYGERSNVVVATHVAIGLVVRPRRCPRLVPATREPRWRADDRDRTRLLHDRPRLDRHALDVHRRRRVAWPLLRAPASGSCSRSRADDSRRKQTGRTSSRSSSTWCWSGPFRPRRSTTRELRARSTRRRTRC